MIKSSLVSQITKPGYMMSRGIYWLLLAALLPVVLAYFQTERTAERKVRVEAERVAAFFISEIDDMLGRTERVLHRYIQDTGGSCTIADLDPLKRHMAQSRNVVTMGVVNPDGHITCQFGDVPDNKISFPPVSRRDLRKPQFAELRRPQGSQPIIIMQSREGMRVFAVMSQSRFTGLLLPGALADYAQIDLVLPDGGLWYTLTGANVVSGFSDDVIKIERTSNRFPVLLGLVVDKSAVSEWSGSLHVALVVIALLCVALILMIATVHFAMTLIKKRQLRVGRERVVENAKALFQITYQPLLNLESKLLVGAVVRADLTIFDAVPDERPAIDEVVGMVWDEIGEFAAKRREFNLVVEIDGKTLLDLNRRDALIAKLRDVNYANLTLLLKWPSDQGFEVNLYKPLETVATAGANLAIDCSRVRFSFLSDMWAWPYHQLIVDFSVVPDSDDAMNWMSEIVMDMSEQLHVDTVAFGLSSKQTLNAAISGGFRVGAGDLLGPNLTIDAFLSAVRPVGSESTADDVEDVAA